MISPGEEAKAYHRSLFLNGPAGRLEAQLWTSPATHAAAASAETPAAVVCHPHPLFGGTMHNKVVFQAAKTLHQFGIPVLRFNFRGAGLSAGRHDRGRGEAGDVRAALDTLAAEFPGRPLLLAGFSFGAWVGLRVGCEDARVAELIGLGLPVNDSDLSYLRACAKPLLVVQGASDPYGAKEKIAALFAGLPESRAGQVEVVFLPGADHFFTGRLDRLDAALRAWLRSRHPAPAASST